MTSLPRGLALNNPMNLMENNIHWQGQIRPTTDSQGRLAKFSSMAFGVRAGAKCLITDYFVNKLLTLRAIINKYAPPNENNPEEYAQTVAGWLDIDPDDNVGLSDPDRLNALCGAIIRFEQGVAIDQQDITDGVELAIKSVPQYYGLLT